MKIVLLPAVFENRTDESAHITLILLAQNLQRKGHKVCIISEGVKGLPTYEKFKTVEIHRGSNLKLPIIKHLSPLFALKKLEKSGAKFDIIHSFSSTRIVAIRTWLSQKLLKDTKTVHSLRSYSQRTLGNSFSKTLSLVDAITVPTTTFSKKLVRAGCNKSKIKVVHSHINTKKFSPKSKARTKKMIGINHKIILYYGNMAENKGSKSLIKIMKNIPTTLRDWRLVIVSRCEAKEQRELIEKLGLEKRVVLIERAVDNIEDYVNAADIVALPYKNLVAIENTPSCILESMACKTAVITSDLPEISELIKNKKEAVLVKAGSLDSFRKELINLMNDDNLRKKLCDQGYRLSKNFSDEIITGKYLRLYESLLKSPTLPKSVSK